LSRVDIANCEIPRNQNPKKTPLTFTDKQIRFINVEINKFQKLVNKDISHWLK
jgi:hypothetical protein